MATAVSPVLANDQLQDSANTTNYVTQITVNKTLTLPQGIESLPAQAFNFTVTATGNNASVAPTPTIGTVNIDAANKTGGVDTSINGTATISFAPKQTTLPDVYTYTLKETNSGATGVTYDTAEYTIEVQVINADENNPGAVVVSDVCVVKTVVENGQTSKVKTSANFTNAYSENANLTLEKQVTGKGANVNDKFEFTVEMTLPAGYTGTNEFEVETTGSVADAANKVTFTNGTATYTAKLADDATVTIKNLPVGTTYTASEANGSYSASLENTKGNSGVQSKDGNTTDSAVLIYDGTNYVKFTNSKDKTPLTGVIVNNMPYIALLGASGAGLVVLAASKKRSK
ncbi:MAG: Spy0128 family protein [Floccifex sp.]